MNFYTQITLKCVHGGGNQCNSLDTYSVFRYSILSEAWNQKNNLWFNKECQYALKEICRIYRALR